MRELRVAVKLSGSDIVQPINGDKIIISHSNHPICVDLYRASFRAESSDLNIDWNIVPGIEFEEYDSYTESFVFKVKDEKLLMCSTINYGISYRLCLL